MFISLSSLVKGLRFTRGEGIKDTAGQEPFCCVTMVDNTLIALKRITQNALKFRRSFPKINILCNENNIW